MLSTVVVSSYIMHVTRQHVTRGSYIMLLPLSSASTRCAPPPSQLDHIASKKALTDDHNTYMVSYRTD